MALRLRLAFSQRGRIRRVHRMSIVGFDDFLNEAVPHDISLIEVDKLDAGNVLQDVADLDEARHSIGRQVDLRDVPRHRLPALARAS